MNKKIFLILFIQILPFALFSQKAWIMNDSIVKIIKFLEGANIENAQICREERNDSVFTYTPYDINWYRYAHRFYLSKDIQFEDETKRVFIERLVAGKISLYFYCDSSSKRFYLERDSSYFTELFEDSENNSVFRDSLSRYCSDCRNVDEAVKSVRYNKESLTLFVKMYNSCKYRPFPFTKFGLYLGLNRSDLSISPGNALGSEVLHSANFNIDHSLLVGIFLDLPILKSSFTFHPEMYFTKNAFSDYQFQNNFYTDIIVNLSTVNVPLLIRYTFPFRNIRPFISSGIIYSYHYRNENVIYKSLILNNVVEIQKESDEKLFQTKQVRLAFGLGCQYMINYKKSVFCELRYNSHSFIESDLRLNDINLNIGINF